MFRRDDETLKNFLHDTKFLLKNRDNTESELNKKILQQSRIIESQESTIDDLNFKLTI